MDAKYDFKAKGYEASGDWSRLNDLLPDNLTKGERELLKRDDCKANVLAALRAHGIEPGPWDAASARTRNAA